MLSLVRLTAIAPLLLCAAMAVSVPARAADLVKINNIGYEADRHSVVLEISGPVTISTRSLKAPPRLVVDVPTATLFSPNQELVIRDAMVQRVRVSQFQILPPVVRVVIETTPADEPLIAVQQTKGKLYITLAPARGADQPASGHGHGHDHGHEHAAPTPTPRATATPRPVPRPTPTPKGFQILPDASPAATPVRVESRPAPTPTPAVRRTAAPAATPAPTPAPSVAPSIAPPRPGEKRGEAAHETLPQLP